MSLEMNSSRRWGDMMVQMDEDRSQRVLRMSDAEWKECAMKTIEANRGRGDLRAVINWLDAMTAKRAEKTEGAVMPEKDMSQTAVMFRVWKDMILEPAKYGDDDWEEWLAMDEELKNGSGRWRMGAFWLELEAEELERARDFYATRIQAAWRGHHVRNTQVGLNCENCLARTFSPQQWDGQHVCLDCLDHRFEHFANFVQPAVMPLPRRPEPGAEPDENGCVPCQGCGSVVVDVDDYGDYRPGWWCSRGCAYDYE